MRISSNNLYYVVLTAHQLEWEAVEVWWEVWWEEQGWSLQLYKQSKKIDIYSQYPAKHLVEKHVIGMCVAN